MKEKNLSKSGENLLRVQEVHGGLCSRALALEWFSIKVLPLHAFYSKDCSLKLGPGILGLS
jgi:hypothetical protein